MANPQRIAAPRRTSELREAAPSRDYQLSPESKVVLSLVADGRDVYEGCESMQHRGQRERTLANLTTRGYVERVEGAYRIKPPG